MVALGGTDFVDIVADSDSAKHMVVVVHIEADTGSNTNWVGIVKDDMMLMPVHPESTHCSS